MTKYEFVTRLAAQNAVPRLYAEKILAAFLDSVEDGLAMDGKVDIRGFGSFKIRVRNSHSGKNPATGESLEIPASKTIVFKPSPALLRDS